MRMRTPITATMMDPVGRAASAPSDDRELAAALELSAALAAVDVGSGPVDPPRAPTAELLIVRVGRERFALELRSVEEAVECPDLQPLPDMDDRLLGLLRLRDRMLAVYAPDTALRVSLAEHQAHVIVLHDDARRIGVAVDDIEDVLPLDLATLRPAPGETDGVLRGIIWRGTDLIAVLDARALIDACLPEPPTGAL
jgi:purine-binding chemotaxis protein CheW